MSAVCVAVTAPAHAQSIGYLTTVEGGIFYPQSSPGGDYSLTSLGTGQYQVTFYGLGNGVNSDVQVTANLGDYGPHYCTTAGWGTPNDTDVTVNVDCFNSSGAPLNSDFSVFYQARTSAPASGAVAFLWANEPSTASYTPSSFYSYNSTGGTNTITRDNTGLYFAYLPGITRTGGNPQVTAYGAVAARCQVIDWYHNHSGTNVAIQCVNAAGNPADEYFDLAFSYGATDAVGGTTSVGAYAWANNPTASSYVPDKAYQFDNVSTKALRAQNAGDTSFLNLYVPETVNFGTTLGLVTAYGSHGEYCDKEGLGYYGSAKQETLTMTVACFNAQGQPAAVDYTAQFITSHGYRDRWRARTRLATRHSTEPFASELQARLTSAKRTPTSVGAVRVRLQL
jgi:hypothetical protein